MTVSIVILTTNRLEMLQHCIDSIRLHTASHYEFVVVMNGSPPEVQRYVDGLGGSVFYNKENLGVTPGRNQGMGLAQGEFVLFLDDDAYITEEVESLQPEDRDLDWLTRMTKWFAEPHVGAVGQSGSYINPQTPGIFWGCKKHGAPCDVVQGYCMMFRRSLIEQIGYLDPAFGKFWHEESEYCLRIKAAGYAVLNLGYVGVTHFGAGSGDDGTYGQKIEYLFRKWRRRFDEILVPRTSWHLQ